MTGEIKFTFEELPLIVDLGFEAGLVNGTAAIKYHDDGEWFIDEIALEGHRERSIAERANLAINDVLGPRFEIKPVIIDRAERPWLYLAIHDQLENGRFKDQIEKHIDEDRAACREDAADQQRERRRDERAEHSTLNRAQQGV